MSAASKLAHVIEMKRQLADKYARLAQNAKSIPRRKNYLNRAEKYANQVRMLVSKQAVKQPAEK